MTPLLEVRDLRVEYPASGLLRRVAPLRAVDRVSFTLAPGETLGLVGESGSGKSSVARGLLRLQGVATGEVRFEGTDLLGLETNALRRMRRRMQIVFQDPGSALNPRMTIGEAVAEGLEIHRLLPPAEIPARVAALLGEVGLDPALARRLPRELSGGQRQRVGIARALAVDPAFLVLDEPVSALDVSVQAQVLTLLRELQEKRGLAYLFIAHDLAVVRQVAHRIAVMYLGRIVEQGPAEALLASARHPYTRALLSAAPLPDPEQAATRILLRGEPPNAAAPPPGCRFHPRCFHRLADARCRAEVPELRPVDATEAACHYASADP